MGVCVIQQEIEKELECARIEIDSQVQREREKRKECF
jgi:hypothetical protein